MENSYAIFQIKEILDFQHFLLWLSNSPSQYLTQSISK